MAVTKIHPIKSTLKKALDYIENPAKTDEKMLVSSFACSYETADIEFELLLSQAMQKGNNLAHHLIQSFAPGETTPEQAHEIGRQLADEVLQGKYPYVLTTHIDKGHVHNHIIFCAAGARRMLEQVDINLKGLNVDKLKAELEELTKQKNELTSTYKNCEKEVRDLKRKQENLNQYLGRTTPPDAAQEQLEKKNTPNL